MYETNYCSLLKKNVKKKTHFHFDVDVFIMTAFFPQHTIRRLTDVAEYEKSEMNCSMQIRLCIQCPPKVLEQNGNIFFQFLKLC